MTKSGRGLLRTIGTRSAIAALPVAMVAAAYTSSGLPTPPRLAEYAYQQVAEITVSPNTVGIAASPLYGQTKAQIDTQLDQMQALGVQNIRVFVPWGTIDFFGPSDPGSASWSSLDLVMQAAKERNMGVMAEINSTPPYASPNGIGSIFGNDSPDPTKFAAFLTKFVSAYGDEVSAYEIWNEPNAVLFSNPMDPAAYAALVKAAYQAIKPLDPTATVVAGAVGHVYTTGFTMDPVDFVKGMVAADPTIGNYFDALSYHPYDETMPFSAGNVDPNSGFFASDTAYNQVKDLMSLFPTKKVWISEFGVPTYSYSYVDLSGATQTVTVTQQQQEDLIKNLLQSWGGLSQAGPIFLYTGRDTAAGSTDPNANYGLYTSNGDPKQVITDFLTQWFIDHPQSATVPTGPTTPTGPTVPGNSTSPGNPAAALTAIIQAIAQQITNVITQAQAFVASFVQAITNFITSLTGQAVTPAATAPLTARTASVVASTNAAADSIPVADAPATSAGAKGAAVKTAAEAVAPATTAAVAVSSVATQTGTTPPVISDPVAADPVVVKAPETTPPEAAKTALAESTTSACAEAATSTSSAVKDVPDSPATSTGADKGTHVRATTGDSDTSAGSTSSDKSGRDSQTTSTTKSISKGHRDVGAAEPKSTSGSKKTTADAGAKSASAGGSESSGSDGGGSEG